MAQLTEFKLPELGENITQGDLVLLMVKRIEPLSDRAIERLSLNGKR